MTSPVCQNRSKAPKQALQLFRANQTDQVKKGGGLGKGGRITANEKEMTDTRLNVPTIKKMLIVASYVH